MYRIPPFQFCYPLNDLRKVKDRSNCHSKKIFSNKEILIEKPGIYLISGSSGAGKSTFLHLLKGIVPFYIPGDLKGDFFFDNKRFDEKSIVDFQNDIVYLFQNPFSQVIHHNLELEFAFTLENLKQNPEVYQQKKRELSEKFCLSHLWKSSTQKLSHGECQKLILASLVALSPKVILLDEPTAFLDPQARHEFYEILRTMKKNHIIILVDHHLKEIADKVDFNFLVSDNGEVLQGQKVEMDKEISFLADFSLTACQHQMKIQLAHMSFQYPEKNEILRDVNLIIENGQVVVIKGRNGAGKSTLLKLMANLMRASKGKVSLFEDGKEIKSRKKLEKVGFVFQNPENNFFYESMEKELQGANRELVNCFFPFLDLSRSPYTFSEGEKRRISILINLIQDKKILFYDEPTFGQDQWNKGKLISIIRELKVKNYIQVIISHDEEFIQAVATNVWELNEGMLHGN